MRHDTWYILVSAFGSGEFDYTTRIKSSETQWFKRLSFHVSKEVELTAYNSFGAE